MAIAFVNSYGTGVTSKTAGLTLTSVGAGFTADVGDLCVFTVAADNSNIGGAASSLTVTDTAANSWSSIILVRDPGSENAGVAIYLVWSKITNAAVNSEIVCTFGTTTTAKVRTDVARFSGVNTTVGSPASITGNTANAADLAKTPAAAGNLLIYALAAESPAAGLGALDSNWTWWDGRGTSGGSSATNISATNLYRIAPDTASQPYDATNQAVDHAALMVEFSIAETLTPRTVRVNVGGTPTVATVRKNVGGTPTVANVYRKA